MFPLIPFVAGVLTGAVALGLARAGRTKAGLDKAQDKLRGATVSSLEAIEHASARARRRLAAEPTTEPATEAEAATTAEAPASAAAQAGGKEA